MPALDRAVELLRDRHKVVIFTGADVSTDSGIPDFRSPGGVWTRYDPRHHDPNVPWRPSSVAQRVSSHSSSHQASPAPCGED